MPLRFMLQAIAEEAQKQEHRFDSVPARLRPISPLTAIIPFAWQGGMQTQPEHRLQHRMML
jgi:hypothetical protein